MNPTSVEQFLEESFIPVDKQAEHLNIHIEKRYRVTDNLVSDMISTVEAESQDIMLIGAGPRFMTDGEKSMTSFFGLFRKKVDDVLEHASCPVAIFVNRDYRNGDEVAVLINGSMDSFLFTYVRRLLEDGGSFIHLYYFSSGSEEYVGQIYKINKQYANRVHLYPLVEIEDLVLPIIHGLLILSYDTCVGIAANEKVFKALPSLLVMKDAS